MRVTTILSLAAAAGVYIVLNKLFSFSWYITIPSALATFIIIRGTVKKLILNRDSTLSSLTPMEEQAHTIAKDGIKRMKELRANTIKIKNNEVAAQVKEISKIGIDIFNTIKENPGDLSRTRQFTNYYVDVTEKLVDRYIQLSSNKLQNDDITSALTEVEEVLGSIKQTYEKQYTALFEDDVLDLEAEIKLLKQTIKLES